MSLALAALGSLVAVASADDWREHAPSGWLVAAEVADLGRFDTRVARLAEPWDADPPSVAALVRGLAGDATADRPWGAVLAAAADGSPVPLVYAPTDDFAAFCDAVRADPAGDLAIGEVAGFPIALTRRGGWAIIAPLEAAGLFDVPPTDRPPIALGSDASVAFSPAGLQLLAERADDRRRDLVRDPLRRVMAPRDWPRTLDGLADRLAPASPVYRRLAQAGVPVALGVDLTTAGDLRVRIDWRVAAENPQPAAELPDDAGAIARLSAVCPAPLGELALAAAESSPESVIEGTEFAQPQWDDFAAAARSLATRVRGVRALLSDPAEGEPLAANQSIAFRWGGDTAALGDALALAVTRWNLLVAATKSRSPMTAAIAPIDQTADAGWRLSLDVLGTGPRELSPEEGEILAAFYGHEDRARIDVVPLGDGAWLATFAGPDARPAAAFARDAPTRSGDSPSPDDAAIARGELRIDRWLGWDHRVRWFGIERAAPGGGPQEVPPATLRITAADGLLFEAVLPRSAYELLVARLRE